MRAVRPPAGRLMLLWFVGTAWLAVWIVLHDRTFDYRLLAAGALLPDIVDGVTGGVGVMHSVVTSIGLLVAVMLVTFGRRPIRRRLLAIPFGTFLHLVFDGAFNTTKVFWWPLAGRVADDSSLPSIERGAVSAGLELVGAAILWWWWKRFALDQPANRTRFLRVGHLPADV
jgi:hypothetical protein